MATLHLGIDVGGTNTKWALVARDAGGWQALDQGQERTPAEGGPSAVLTLLAGLASRARDRSSDLASVGIGVPGPYDPSSGTVRDLTNFPGEWNGVAVAGAVGDAVRLPAFLINDARAFGLAELRLGAGRGASSMVGLTLGTGLGGVVAIDGRVYQGHDGAAGELGHQTLEPNGLDCNCGNRGCLEAYVRADRLAAACEAPTADEAIYRARSGDRPATEGMARAGRYLGIGLANVITLITPDRVVIGGGYGTAAFDLLIGPMRGELRRRVRMTRLERVEIVPAELGVWAGAIGAAIHGAESASANS